MRKIKQLRFYNENNEKNSYILNSDLDLFQDCFKVIEFTVQAPPNTLFQIVNVEEKINTQFMVGLTGQFKYPESLPKLTQLNCIKIQWPMVITIIYEENI